MNESIGIMDQAYFVSKNEILKWVNQILKLNIEKIEQLGSGAVYCQIADIIYPGDVNMSKVNWKAKLTHEFVQNYKILQQVFQKHKVQRHLEVEKLTKCKYQDNLEFVQWFKRFFDLNCGERGNDYDPEARRKGASLQNNSNSMVNKDKKSTPAQKTPLKSMTTSSNQMSVANKENKQSNANTMSTMSSMSQSKKSMVQTKSTISSNNLKRKTMVEPTVNFEEIHKKIKTVLMNEEMNNDDKINTISTMFSINMDKMNLNSSQKPEQMEQPTNSPEKQETMQPSYDGLTPQVTAQ